MYWSYPKAFDNGGHVYRDRAPAHRLFGLFIEVITTPWWLRQQHRTPWPNGNGLSDTLVTNVMHKLESVGYPQYRIGCDCMSEVDTQLLMYGALWPRAVRFWRTRKRCVLWSHYRSGICRGIIRNTEKTPGRTLTPIMAETILFLHR